MPKWARWLMLGVLLLFMLGVARPAAAHVGDRGPLQALEVNAGPYDLLITLTIPTALPGPLLVSVNAVGEFAPATIDLRLTRYGSPFPAAPAVSFAPDTAPARLDIDGPGDWEVELRAQGDRGAGLARIPLTVIQPALPPTTIPLAVALGALVISLLAGALVGGGRRAARSGYAAALRAFNLMAFASVVAAAIFGWQQLTWPQLGAPAPAGYSGELPHVNLLLTTEPAEPATGAPLTITLDVRDGATGLPADDLTPHHDALIHLALIDERGEFYAHLHPARIAPGLFVVTITPDRPGRYTAYAELARHNGGSQIVSASFGVSGDAAMPSAPLAGLGRREIGALTIDLRAEPAPLRAGQLTALTVAVADANGPVDDLEPWLSMGGHLMLRRADGALFSHIHAAAPMAAPGSSLRYGPELRFVHSFPSAGEYQAWFQIRHQGKVITIPALLEVAP